MPANPSRWFDVGDPADTRRLLRQVALIFLIVAAVAGYGLAMVRQDAAANERQRAVRVVEDQLRDLVQTMQQALSATQALAALVRQGNGKVANFEAVAGEMLQLYPGVGALQLAPQGVIRHSMPLHGNEKAIGHDLLADPKRTKEAFLARDSGRLTLAGPFPLVQGGLGAVGRYPVFLDGDELGNPRFWGFTTVLLRFPAILDVAGLSRLHQQGYNFVLWRVHPDTGERQIIASSGPERLGDPVEQSFDVPNGQWTLAVEPAGGWQSARAFGGDVVVAVLLTVLLTTVAAMALRNPLLLRVEEARRRREVEASEARFREFFDSNSSVMLIVEPTTRRVVAANAAAAAYYGHSREQLARMRAEEIGDLPPSRLAPGVPVLHRLGSGELRHVELHPTPLVSDGRELLFVIVHDVSERRRAEQQLAEQRERLEELVKQRTAALSKALEDAQRADRTKDTFLANMSHELRTPLNGVIGMAALARAACSDERQARYLDHIVSSGRHLNRIINDLLDLSKITAGHLAIESLDFGLRGVVDHALAAVRGSADAKRLELSATLASDLPDCLRGDPVRIEQILLNLLDNAIKFTPEGRVGLSIELVENGSDRLVLSIVVEDSGIGMKAADVDQLFRPFSQVDASFSRPYGGTGLGLAITKRLVELMDGEIRIDSREGAGTTVRATLRLGHGDPAALARAALPVFEPVPVAYEGARVLIVDDQQLNREIVDELLRAVGVATRMAGNGREAVEILEAEGAQAFDLVLMDIQMPVMDGISATRKLRLRREFATLPIVALTAHTMTHEIESFAAAGLNDHIGKPFDNAVFYRGVAKWIPREKRRAAPVVAAPTAAAATAKPTAAPTAATPDAIGTRLTAIAGLDAVAALARFSNRDALYHRWLKDFVATSAALLDSIGGDLAGGNAEAAARTAHSLKGKVGMLGMTRLHERVSLLERALRDGQPADALLAEVATLAGEMRAQLAAYFDSDATVG